MTAVRFEQLTLSFIVTFVFFSTTYASHSSEADGLASELAASLIDMGYTDVEVGQCRMRFSRELNNTCPSDRAISYSRDINIKNIDVDEGTMVSEIEDGTRKYYELKYEPTKDYHKFQSAYSYFDSEVRVRYPNVIWSYSFDESTPLIRDLFYQVFRADSDVNWWISNTCFGEAPDFDIEFRLSYSDAAPLEKFREILVDYTQSSDCTQN